MADPRGARLNRVISVIVHKKVSKYKYKCLLTVNKARIFPHLSGFVLYFTVFRKMIACIFLFVRHGSHETNF